MMTLSGSFRVLEYYMELTKKDGDRIRATHIKTSVPSVASKGPYELLLRGRFAWAICINHMGADKLELTILISLV